MAREIRNTPQAFNEPMRILGVPILGIGAGILLWLAISHWNGKLALGVFIALMLLLKWLDHIDPRWHATMWAAFRMKPLYDPLKREHFDTRIVE